jgi:O-antigen/teichoic acid export membrane protein
MVQVIKDFFIYVVGSILLRGISAALAPLILPAISPEQYGVLALVTSFIALVIPVAGLGLRQVLSIEYFHHDTQSRAPLINTIIGIYLLCATPFFAILYVLHTVILKPYGHVTYNSQLFTCGLAIAFLHFFVELLYQLLRYEQRSMLLISIQIGSALITACCTLGFLYLLNLGIASVLLAQLITLIIGTGIGIAYYRSTIYHHSSHVRITRHTVKQYLLYGLPFIPNTLFAWFLAAGDRWMLAHYATLHEVGIYALADTACQLFQLLILNSWAGSYLPYILKCYAQNKTQILTIERINLHYMVLSMVGCISGITLGYFLGTPCIMWLLPPSYHAAIAPLWILLLGQICLLGSYFASTFIQFHKKRWFLSLGLCLPACINIVLNYYWIPAFGLNGCTYATLTAYSIYFVITVCYNLFLQKQIVKRSLNEIDSTLYIPASLDNNHGTTRTAEQEQELAKF